LDPLNSTISPKGDTAGSKAIAAELRAGGLADGASWLQVVPLKLQVSPNAPPTVPSLPPNRSRLPVAASKAMAGEVRADGLVGGVSGVHVVPS
jgi:hypothetical protein